MKKASVQFSKALSDIFSEYSLAGGYLSCDNSLIETLGSFANFPSSVTKFNGSRSLIGSFAFIWDLLAIAPQLEMIQLGRIFFIDHPSSPNTFDLKILILNDTNINDAGLEILLRSLPKLTKLDITGCFEIKNFSFSSLPIESIHLDRLGIKDFNFFSNVCGQMKNLSFLSINGNEIEKLEYADNTFLKLETLWINGNNFSDFQNFDGLTKFPNLINLRARRNPFEKTYGEVDVRMILIARYPKIQFLNGSEVSNSERRDCEIQYLSYFATKVLANGKTEHPRWDELCEKYGEPAVTQKKTEGIKTVRVIFERDGEKFEEELILSITVESITSLAASLFDLDEYEVVLQMEFGEYKTVLNYEDQTIEDIGCCDGTFFHVLVHGEETFDERTMAQNFRLRSIAEKVIGQDS